MSALATYSRERGIGRIGLRSPANGNAIGRVLANDLKCAVESCLVDRGVRVILVEADGRNFCVGGDITAFDAPVDERRTSIRQITSDFHAAMELMLSSDRPVITAVQGTAAGAGMSLAVAGDIVIAAEDARFVPAFTAIGLSADGGTTWLLPRLIGVRRSAELLLTNRHLDARQAETWGLVSEVCARATLTQQAEELASRLATGPGAAFGTIKRLLRESSQMAFAEQVAAEAEAITAHALGPDGEEGIAAFQAKRRPNFTRSADRHGHLHDQVRPRNTR